MVVRKRPKRADPAVMLLVVGGRVVGSSGVQLDGSRREEEGEVPDFEAQLGGQEGEEVEFGERDDCFWVVDCFFVGLERGGGR